MGNHRLWLHRGADGADSMPSLSVKYPEDLRVQNKSKSLRVREIILLCNAYQRHSGGALRALMCVLLCAGLDRTFIEDNLKKIWRTFCGLCVGYFE